MVTGENDISFDKFPYGLKEYYNVKWEANKMVFLQEIITLQTSDVTVLEKLRNVWIYCLNAHFTENKGTRCPVVFPAMSHKLVIMHILINHHKLSNENNFIDGKEGPIFIKIKTLR